MQSIHEIHIVFSIKLYLHNTQYNIKDIIKFLQHAVHMKENFLKRSLFCRAQALITEIKIYLLLVEFKSSINEAKLIRPRKFHNKT